MITPWQFEATGNAEHYRLAVHLYIEDLMRRVQIVGDLTPRRVLVLMQEDLADVKSDNRQGMTEGDYMITVRCRYCNGSFDRTGTSTARFCCRDCEFWATHTEWWDNIPPVERAKADHCAVSFPLPSAGQ